MKTGDKVKIKPLTFLAKELHGKTAQVISTHPLHDYSRGETFLSVRIKLDEPVSLGSHVSHQYTDLIFSDDCLEVVK